MMMMMIAINGNERLSLSFLLLRTSTIANNYRLISLLDRVSISLDSFNQYWKLIILSTVTAVRLGTVLLPSDKPLSPLADSSEALGVWGSAPKGIGLVRV